MFFFTKEKTKQTAQCGPFSRVSAQDGADEFYTGFAQVTRHRIGVLQYAQFQTSHSLGLNEKMYRFILDLLQVHKKLELHKLCNVLFKERWKWRNNNEANLIRKTQEGLYRER